jgi:hypothetical protein
MENNARPRLAARISRRMARLALPRPAILLVLATLVSGMPPRPTRTQPRLQCPTCFKPFRSETALRQHRGALLANPARKNGQSACAADQRMPLMSSWSGQGQRAAGTAQRLDRRVLLQGYESDSDSPGDSDGEVGALSPVHWGLGGSPSPPPVDLPGVPPADAPAADGWAPQVHTDIYIQIHTYTCQYGFTYGHIHTNMVH